MSAELMSPVVSGLNPRQLEAATLGQENALIIAGAGSGKTRVLVHRIAWLIQEQQFAPQEILAVTFTNKAAHEMRERLESQFQLSTLGLWVGTFHGIAHRLLRMHYLQAGLPEDFQILDSDDQYRLIRRTMKSLGMDEKVLPPKQVQGFINSQKEQIRRANQVSADYRNAELVTIYRAYEDTCQQSGLVDFAELLLRVYEMLRDDAELRSHYQQRFLHILIDEFQDTNRLQYAWIQLLVGRDTVVMAVGDDDQAIYGWRGADVGNIRAFEQDFAPVAVVRLEQNYRSTQTILDAANAVIENNDDRMGKTLWSQAEQGEPIQVYSGFNEVDEARYIVSRIEHYVTQGYQRQDMAILYRSNAQSRILEEALLQAGIAYRVYGGMRFFERAEIKDALGYLRLLNRLEDDGALERIINLPTRGIGERTVEQIRQHARAQGSSLWQAIMELTQDRALGRSTNAVIKFRELIEGMRASAADLPLYRQVETILEWSQLSQHYLKEPGDKAQSRIENLGELVSAAKQFYPGAETVGTELSAFLSHAVLEAGEMQADVATDAVQLMTLHSAKGLEFPIVFLSGMEEQLFPSRQTMESAERLAEERRLCYVGMTRAMQKLILTYAESRRWFGKTELHMPSRFLREIPDALLFQVRMRSEVVRPRAYQPSTPKPTRRYNASAPSCTAGGQTIRVGQTVSHPKFGEGVVLNYEGNGDDAKLHIAFAESGSKWIAAGFVNCL